MQGSERMLVIGGGIGGVAVAAALRAGGVPAVVFERQPEFRDLGTDFGIRRVAAQALSMLDSAMRRVRSRGPGFEALRLLSWGVHRWPGGARLGAGRSGWAAFVPAERKRISRTSLIVKGSARLAKLSHVKHLVALFVRECVLSAMPWRFWLVLWEHERAYQIK